MKLSDRDLAALKRLGRMVAFAALGVLVSYSLQWSQSGPASPDIHVLVAGLVGAVAGATDKWLRWEEDPGPTPPAA